MVVELVVVVAGTERAPVSHLLVVVGTVLMEAVVVVVVVVVVAGAKKVMSMCMQAVLHMGGRCNCLPPWPSQ
jgi:hypothetical protein